MKEFKIEIEERLKRVVTKQTETIEDALEQVEEEYNDAEIILDDNDYKGYETREEGRLAKDYVFYTGYGPAILLEGGKNLGIIKLLNDYESGKNYIVAESIKYEPKYENFEWKNEERFNNIISAVEYFDKKQNYKLLNNHIELTNEIPNYRKLEIFESLIEDLFVGRNLSEVVEILHNNYELSNEEIKVITQCDDIETYLDEEQEPKI